MRVDKQKDKKKRERERERERGREREEKSVTVKYLPNLLLSFLMRDISPQISTETAVRPA